MLVIQERHYFPQAATFVPQQTVTYTHGIDLSGTRQGAGGIGGLLARTDSNGSAFYHCDAMGNITAMVDASGNEVAAYLYDPYGNLLGKWGSLADANVYRFSSEELHLASGIYHFEYRDYDPNLQRWLSRDPIGEQEGPNLYAYVENDPNDWIDPLGLGMFSEHFVGPLQVGDIIVRDGGSQTLTMTPSGPVPTDGGITDLSQDYWDLFNAARNIPRDLYGLGQSAVCWGKQKVMRSLEDYWKNKRAQPK
jgi:RHS repeat-associated protein